MLSIWTSLEFCHLVTSYRAEKSLEKETMLATNIALFSHTVFLAICDWVVKTGNGSVESFILHHTTEIENSPTPKTFDHDKTSMTSKLTLNFERIEKIEGKILSPFLTLFSKAFFLLLMTRVESNVGKRGNIFSSSHTVFKSLFPCGGYSFPKQAFFFLSCLQYKPSENTVGKGEIARYEQFLLFPQYFLLFWRTFRHFHQILNCRLQTLSVWKTLIFVVW